MRPYEKSTAGSGCATWLEKLAVLEVDDADVGWAGQPRVGAAKLDAKSGDVYFCGLAETGLM